jgi:integrase
VTAVKRAFSWLDQQGVLSPNPMRNVEKPAARRTRILTSAEREEILAAVPDRNFREFLVALYQTGCRPSEVTRVTAATVHPDLGVWDFDEHEAANTGKPRVIYLTPEMVEVSRRLVAERPAGPLFPSAQLRAAVHQEPSYGLGGAAAGAASALGFDFDPTVFTAVTR